MQEPPHEPRNPTSVEFLAMISILLAAITLSWSLADTAPASRPPVVADFKAEAVSKTMMAGRKVFRYEHEMIEEWGYEPGAIKRPFIVVEPAKPTDSPPMLVYLHSAGNEFGPSIPSQLNGFGPEFLTLAVHSVGGPDGWHGWHWIAKDPKKYGSTYAPPEHRLLATIEWVARKYRVDRNRIYLWGISMGGSGTLGLGMARGDIFAALWVVVPAGIDHGWHRMLFPERKPLAPRPTVGPSLEVTRPANYLVRFGGRLARSSADCQFLLPDRWLGAESGKPTPGRP